MARLYLAPWLRPLDRGGVWLAFALGGCTATECLQYGARPLRTNPSGVHQRSEVSMSSASQWPADLDALVAAPNHHRVLLENARVRVLDTRIAPRGADACPHASVARCAFHAELERVCAA